MKIWLILLLSFTAQAKAPLVLVKTTLGNFKVELNEKKAPLSVKNFLGYVRSGFYEGTTFHRVIKNFMIQGGGFDTAMKQKVVKKPIQNEAKNGLSNLKGTISMARTNVVNSATSQFFINTVDNKFLDHQSKSNYGYAVFGKVVEGMEVVEKMRKMSTHRKGRFENYPIKNIVIIGTKIL